MPVSSKSIINLINSFPQNFTREQIVTSVLSGKDKQKNFRVKRKSHKPKKDLARIDDTLAVLTSAGFLRRSRGKYTKITSLAMNGQINMNSSGNAMVTCDDGWEIIVKKGNTGLAHDQDQVRVTIYDYKRGYFYGEVTKIHKRARSRYTARVHKKSPGQIYLHLLDQPGAGEICAERMDPEPEIGDVATVILTGRQLGNRPHCLINEFFSLADETGDFTRICSRHSLPGEHPAYDELAGVEDIISENEAASRKDYRDLLTVTIDGEYAKDFDDAISLNTTKNGYVLYVHIADVSHYVKQGTTLDREALERGTSFYLGNKVIPMLPEVLSNNLCSLRQGRDRLTMTAEISIDLKGNINSAEFFSGIIRVNSRLTYEGAEGILNSASDDETAPLLTNMSTLAKILKKKRMGAGRLDLNLPDEELIYDGDHIKEIVFAKRLESHKIIEEFMLTANEAVSKRLRTADVPTLYRIHEQISDDSLISLKNFFGQLGIKFTITGEPGTALQSIIESVEGRDFDQVINLVILKSLMQAYYGTTPLGHFGLGFRDYTHFTSPIRRYPDLVVHRCLKALIQGQALPYSREELDPVGEKTSDMERVAQKAERDMVKIKSCRILYDRKGEIFDAIISGIQDFGFFVTLLEMPIEGVVPLRFLTDDYYLVKEDDYTVVGRKYGRRFRLGDRLQVRLASVEIETMRIDFDLP